MKIIYLFLLLSMKTFANNSDSAKMNLSPKQNITAKNLQVAQEPSKKVGESTPQKQGKKYKTSLTTKTLDIHTALALIAESNGFRLRVDTLLSGEISLDLQETPLAEALDTILKPKNLSWHIEDKVIIVGERKSQKRKRKMLTVTGNDTYRIFTINYPRLVRSGTGNSSVTVSSNSSGEAGKVSLSMKDEITFWEELQKELKEIIPQKATMTINNTSGTIFLRAEKEYLDQTQHYLEELLQPLLRQVEITARIYEVTLNDDNSLGIDWNRVHFLIESSGKSISTTLATSLSVNNPSLKKDGINIALSDRAGDINAVLTAIEEQGEVHVVSQPRVVTLNNQPALVKVGTDQPYFSVTQTIDAETGSKDISEVVTVLTIGVVLSVTPQISEHDWITLEVAPMITDLVATVTSQYNSTAPIVDIKQSSSMIRLRNGETTSISGLIRTKESDLQRKIPLLGNIPILGHFFRWSYKLKEKKELVIFITPTIVE